MRPRVLRLVPALLTLAACASGPPAPRPGAVADLKNALGQAVGRATFTEVAGGVRLVVDVRAFQPGDRGIHVHAVGRCDPPAFTSAGGHFNPLDRRHGLASPGGPHAGDLPGIAVGADGRGHLDVVTDRLSLGAGPTSIFDADGSALVVHDRPDDQRTEPTGNSGGRAACGVVVRN
jgi:Cu-Zn family superoxide dismutase